MQTNVILPEEVWSRDPAYIARKQAEEQERWRKSIEANNSGQYTLTPRSGKLPNPGLRAGEKGTPAFKGGRDRKPVLEAGGTRNYWQKMPQYRATPEDLMKIQGLPPLAFALKRPTPPAPPAPSPLPEPPAMPPSGINWKQNRKGKSRRSGLIDLRAY